MKRLLITILMLATIAVAQMTNIADDSLLRLEHIVYGEEIISIPDGYDSMREGSQVKEYNGQLIWLSTLVKEVNGEDYYSLHGWTCDGDLEKWNYRGKLELLGAGGVVREAEDPDFWFNKVGNYWEMLVEDKSEEKTYNRFVVSHYRTFTDDFFGTWYFLGGSTGLAPFGDDFAQDAIYSPYADGDDLVFDGRKGRWTEEVGYAKWDGNKYVPDPEPTLTVNDISQPSSNIGIVLTTGVGAIFKVNDKYVMHIPVFKDWSKEIWEEADPNAYNGYWCSQLAVSNSLRDKWTVLDGEIKTDDGKHASVTFFYTDKWRALGFGADGKSVNLAEVVTSSTEPEPEPEPVPPVNGETGIPTNLQFNNNILSWGWSGEAVDKFDICATNVNAIDWIGDTQEKSFNIPTQFIAGDIQEFWIVAVIGNVKHFSNRITVIHNPTEPPIPPQPIPDNETYKTNIKNYLELIEIEVDKIK